MTKRVSGPEGSAIDSQLGGFKKMRNVRFGILVGSVIGLALPGAAFSADLPYKAPPPAIATWTGCYFGANIGGGFAHQHYSFGAIPDAADYHPSGFVGGGQVGCDYQAGAFVFGVQGMFDGSTVRGSGSYLPDPAGFSEDTRIPWFATVTARVGFNPRSDILLYLKGGGAWLRDEATEYRTSGAVGAVNTSTRDGYLFGAGSEYMITKKWSVFVEYNYIDLGNKNLFFTGVTENSFVFGSKETFQTILAGANYRFNWYR